MCLIPDIKFHERLSSVGVAQKPIGALRECECALLRTAKRFVGRVIFPAHACCSRWV